MRIKIGSDSRRKVERVFELERFESGTMGDIVLADCYVVVLFATREVARLARYSTADSVWWSFDSEVRHKDFAPRRLCVYI